MTHRPKLARPVMRPATCFQRYQAARVRGEEVERLATREPTAEHRSTNRICPMRMGNMLDNIQPDRDGL